MLSCAGDRMCSEAAQRHSETAPREPKSQRVCVRVSSVYLCLSVRVCSFACLCVCACKRDRVSWRNRERPTDRQRDRVWEGALFISITDVFASRVQYLTSVCHCGDSYHYISFSLQ